MSTRIRYASADPHASAQIKTVIDAAPSEAQKPRLPKPTPLENLKRWKIQALAARSRSRSEEWQQ